MGQQETVRKDPIEQIIQVSLCITVLVVGRMFFDWPRLPKFRKVSSVTKVDVPPKMNELSKSEFESIVYRWESLTFQEQQRLTAARDEILRAAGKAYFGRSKADWNALDDRQQIEICELTESALQSLGYTTAEANGFSLFIGPFMDASPTQATIKDAVVQYKTMLNQRRAQQGVAAIERVLDFALTAAQISQAMQEH